MMAFQNIGVISADEVLTKASLAPGTRVIGGTNGALLPDKFTRAYVFVDISSITNMTTVLQLAVQLSFDGGANWQQVGNVGLNFNVAGFSVNASNMLVDAGGEPVRVFGQSLRLPNAVNLTRRIRGSLVFSNNQSANQTFGVSVVIW